MLVQKVQRKAGLPIPVVITVYADRSFTLDKNSTCSSAVEKSGRNQIWFRQPNKDKVGKVTRAQIREIAETKAADMTGATVETK